MLTVLRPHSVSPGVQFSREAEGVYSCIIPDENGVEQILHFGLYDYNFTSGERTLAANRGCELFRPHVVATKEPGQWDHLVSTCRHLRCSTIVILIPLERISFIYLCN